jgi:hypothetical protein
VLVSLFIYSFAEISGNREDEDAYFSGLKIKIYGPSIIIAYPDCTVFGSADRACIGKIGKIKNSCLNIFFKVR